MDDSTLLLVGLGAAALIFLTKNPVSNILNDVERPIGALENVLSRDPTQGPSRGPPSGIADVLLFPWSVAWV